MSGLRSSRRSGRLELLPHGSQGGANMLLHSFVFASGVPKSGSFCRIHVSNMLDFSNLDGLVEANGLALPSFVKEAVLAGKGRKWPFHTVMDLSVRKMR